MLHDEHLVQAIIERVLGLGQLLGLDGASVRTLHVNIDAAIRSIQVRVPICSESPEKVGQNHPNPQRPGSFDARVSHRCHASAQKGAGRFEVLEKMRLQLIRSRPTTWSRRHVQQAKFWSRRKCLAILLVILAGRQGFEPR